MRSYDKHSTRGALLPNKKKKPVQFFTESHQKTVNVCHHRFGHSKPLFSLIINKISTSGHRFVPSVRFDNASVRKFTRIVRIRNLRLPIFEQSLSSVINSFAALFGFSTILFSSNVRRARVLLITAEMCF